MVLHKQLIAEGVSIGSLDPERKAKVGFIDKPKAVFEGDKFGLQKKSLLEDDGPFVVVLLLGGSELNDILGLLVDHDEGVKVEGITLVVAFLIVEAKFYYELFHVVVEMLVVIELFLLALLEDELLFILTFFLDYFDSNIVAELVFDDEEGHHCEIYHLLHTILQYVRTVNLVFSHRLVILVDDAEKGKLLVGHKLIDPMFLFLQNEFHRLGIFSQIFQFVHPVALPPST